MNLTVDVVIIGGGPVGLALSADLAWRGHQVLLLEKGDGSIYQPKMDLVGIRTMEFCRKWGIVRDVEESDYDRNYPQDNVYLTSLNGYELGRQEMPSMNNELPPNESPQKRERCPQNYFDPILRKFATAQSTNQIYYETECIAFSQSQNQVKIQAKDIKTNRVLNIKAIFLVGCDGAKSLIRDSLNIKMSGKGLLTYTTNVIFECSGFNSLHNKAPGYRYMFIGPNGTWCTIVAINGKDQWRMSLIGSAEEKKTYTEDEIKAFAFKALGKPFEMKIISILPWQRAELVAERYRDKNVFICGDACHLTSPTGGLGMNTGIGDAVDLSWKLSGYLQGWGGEQLLDSYTIERKPIAERITQFSTGNLEIMKKLPSNDSIYEDSNEGQIVRAKVGHAMTEGLKREWFSLNMHLGNRYTNSPINIYEEFEDPVKQKFEFEDSINYIPSTRPGCRAPHVWLDKELSTLDLINKKFSLFCFVDISEEINLLCQYADQLKIPITVFFIDSVKTKLLFEFNYLMIRPDGHIAWRGNNCKIEPSYFWSKITGNA
ncbi:MAG: FAD-dependent monooxygenase [Betaproteobacteria bacterium]|jgi:2-polyprenyl-6-methoxyphenol hydroxylase-like FAD-dependent oxidoreductase